MNKYKIELAEVLKKLSYGFCMYENTFIIIEEALSMIDIKLKYPNAISIIQI